jgi:hypothetical protein
MNDHNYNNNNVTAPPPSEVALHVNNNGNYPSSSSNDNNNPAANNNNNNNNPNYNSSNDGKYGKSSALSPAGAAEAAAIGAPPNSPNVNARAPSFGGAPLKESSGSSRCGQWLRRWIAPWILCLVSVVLVLYWYVACRLPLRRERGEGKCVHPTHVACRCA